MNVHEAIGTIAPINLSISVDNTHSPLNPLIKLNPLPSTNVNNPTLITAPLLLILLFRKPLSLRHAQILMRALRIIVAAVRIRSHLWVNGGIFGNALEGFILFLPLLLSGGWGLRGAFAFG